MALADICHGHGVVVLDPKRDLVTDIADRIPEERRSDVVVIDPADTDRPVGFNPLALGTRPPELVVDHLVSVFAGLYRAYWGPRTDDIFRACLLTLTTTRSDGSAATLLDVPTLLTNDAFRRRLVGQLNDSIGLGSFWGWYEALSPAERSHVIGPVFNKLRAFLMRPQIRRLVGQTEPAWDLDAALRDGQVVLVPLSAGQLGEEAARLLGALIVARLWQSVQARAGSPGRRRLSLLYLDEFQNFLHLPTSVGEMLAQARGLGLGLTLAHQHLGQLSNTVRDDVLANCRSRVVFQMNQRDAKTLIGEMPGLDAQDLIELGPYEIFARLAAGGSVHRPASARTRPLPDSLDSASDVVERSRSRFGQPARTVNPDQPDDAHDLDGSEVDGGDWEVPIGGRPVDESGSEKVDQ